MYQQGVHQLVQYQMLLNNIMRIEWQTVRRITSEILWVKALNIFVKV